MPVNDNVDLDEIAKFEKLASRWWDPNSEFKPLHDINPLRAGWIDQHADVKGKNVLDVGCGGGSLRGTGAPRRHRHGHRYGRSALGVAAASPAGERC